MTFNELFITDVYIFIKEIRHNADKIRYSRSIYRIFLVRRTVIILLYS